MPHDHCTARYASLVITFALLSILMTVGVISFVSTVLPGLSGDADLR